ncbi:Biopolymer transport protein ExbD/TolR [Candidatus Omnitrophus magneticus]|uniref:Biopolymer transport protein ExbD/TolR n=1 Tax=Candidatus Omnitrophus magneticus TaxID=1609969 RepID=A0A0F0CP34_9BACT|nr:Biopolymer transport protein ExbD/TolR [Candidatus Omnitrophus magneticus]
MTPLIDMMFILVIFLMCGFVFFQIEAELDIAIPKSKESTQTERMPGEIIINVRESGEIIVNQRSLTCDDLSSILKKVSELYKGQPVIIRGDENTKHKFIIQILDLCAGANIWNVSFATLKEEKKY